jgi:hypothetical protein
MVLFMAIGIILGGVLWANAGVAASQRPTDADLMAFKVYHHTVYKETTTKQAGGTNKLLHTTLSPTVSPKSGYISKK